MIDLLSRDNPRLRELEAAYAGLSLPFEHSLWKTWADQIDIQNFRGENAYLSQMWNMTEARYQNTYDYLVSLGEGETIARLGEDNAFGCITFERDGVTFSRDLLDSVCELRFLREALGFTKITGFGALDIGAGYGRFAHRANPLFPGAFIWCVDAVPLSTFLCDFYLHYRGDLMAYTVPLHQLAQEPLALDFACNMYSFSEMPLAAVNFWLDRCADLNITYFFLVPHAPDLVHPGFLTTEPDGSHQDYYTLFAQHGYRLVRQVPKFPHELAPSLIFSTDYLLFERRA